MESKTQKRPGKGSKKTGLAESAQLDAVFSALADPTRRAILARLAKGEASVNELVQPFNMSQPGISKHLKILEKAGLVTMDKDAQRRPRRLEAKPLADATEWLEKYRQFWERRYNTLSNLLDELQSDTREQSKKIKEIQDEN